MLGNPSHVAALLRVLCAMLQLRTLALSLAATRVAAGEVAALAPRLPVRLERLALDLGGTTMGDAGDLALRGMG